ncbi:MAG: hypothetical protein ACRD2L_04545 [Terriglobia bacterium]
MDIEKQDILDLNSPLISTTSDIPVIETKPDATPEAVTAEPEKAKEVETKTAEEATAETEEEPGAAPEKPKGTPKGVQKRLDELTRRIEEERREKLRLLALVEGHQTQPKEEVEVTEPEPVRPSKADYPEQDAWDGALMSYADAKAQWTARKEVKSLLEQERRTQVERSQKDAQEQARLAYSQRVEKVKSKYADFDEVAGSPDVSVPMAVAHAIVQAENGPELQYYFGSHPEEAKRLTDLSPALQLVELGRIAAKLDQPVVKPKLSNAPEPLKPLKAGDTPKAVNLQDADMDAYVAARKAQQKDLRTH